MIDQIVDLDLEHFHAVVISPGPGLPSELGLTEVIHRLDSKVPVLGICLGMQAIGEYLKGSLYNLKEVKHGVQELILCSNSHLLKDGITEVGLYHSWALKEDGDFTVVARSQSGIVMAIENHNRKLYGVQFHPESVMTPSGFMILENFINLVSASNHKNTPS